MKASIPQTQGEALAQAFSTFDAQMKEYLTQRLAGFADQMRANMGVGQLHHIESDAALILFDLCRYLALSIEQQQRVLGPSQAYIDVLESTHVTVESFFQSAILIDA